MKEPSSNSSAAGAEATDAATATGENALRWAHARGAAARIAEGSRVERRRRRQVRQAWAGGVAAVLLAVGLWQWGQRAPAVISPSEADAAEAAAALPAAQSTLVISQPVRQVLPDGSVVELKDGAAISVEYSATVRRVRLERGEAHFAVAPNAAVPFIVSAGGVGVRAVGTEFAVELTARNVEVLVTEGRVAVESAADTSDTSNTSAASSASDITSPGAASLTASASATTPAAMPKEFARLSAGQAATIELAALTSITEPAVPAEEQRARLAWRVPRIELSRTPLAEVVECFNRYGAVRLELADPALGALQLSGVLRPDSPHALLHILKSDFGLRETRRADATIVLQRP